MNKNHTVEEMLIKALKELKNFSWKKGFPVLCWNFNSEFGNGPIYQNSPIKTKISIALTREQKSMYHAERNCLNGLTKQEKECGQNTLFITLIPCTMCLKFLWKEPEDYHVIYFIDHLNKADRDSYIKWNKRVPFEKYITKDSKIQKVIDEIKEVYITREISVNGDDWKNT